MVASQSSSLWAHTLNLKFSSLLCVVAWLLLRPAREWTTRLVRKFEPKPWHFIFQFRLFWYLLISFLYSLVRNTFHESIPRNFNSTRMIWYSFSQIPHKNFVTKFFFVRPISNFFWIRMWLFLKKKTTLSKFLSIQKFECRFLKGNFFFCDSSHLFCTPSVCQVEDGWITNL